MDQSERRWFLVLRATLTALGASACALFTVVAGGARCSWAGENGMHGVGSLIVLDRQRGVIVCVQPGSDASKGEVLLRSVQSIDVLPDGTFACVQGDGGSSRLLRGRLRAGGHLLIDKECGATRRATALALAPGGACAAVCTVASDGQGSTLALIGLDGNAEVRELLPAAESDAVHEILQPTWNHEGDKLAFYWHHYARGKPDYEGGGFAVAVCDVKTATVSCVAPRSKYMPTSIGSIWNPMPRHRPLWSHDDAELLVDAAYSWQENREHGGMFFGPFLVGVNGGERVPLDKSLWGATTLWSPWTDREFICHVATEKPDEDRLFRWSQKDGVRLILAGKRVAWATIFGQRLLVCERDGGRGRSIVRLWTPEEGWVGPPTTVPEYTTVADVYSLPGTDARPVLGDQGQVGERNQKKTHERQTDAMKASPLVWGVVGFMLGGITGAGTTIMLRRRSSAQRGRLRGREEDK